MATYHGLHEYSTFSASTINLAGVDGKNTNKKWYCLLCRLSESLIFHPVGPFRCCWDLWVMLLLIYTSIEIPYTISFGTTSIIERIGLLIDLFLCIDIFLNFHTAYFDKYDNLRLITNKKYICKKYFRTWFFIDFLTCIPFEFIFPDHTENDNTGAQKANALTYIKILRIFRLLRIIKILRFLKMLRIFDALMKQFIVREVIVFMKVFKIVSGMLMFAHFSACLWWFVGTNTSPSWVDKIDESKLTTSFEEYSHAWYWSVVTLFTTGYGDIVATNCAEQWVSSICILIGTCFFAYFVGTLTVLITEGDKIKSYELDKVEEAQSFCEKKKLPKELTRAILTHIRYHCTYNYVFDETELLNILPSYLQHDIHTYCSKQFLLKLNIFQNEYIHLPDFIIGLIAIKTKSISCNQSYKLFDIGDMAKEFYIQRTGKSIMYNKENKRLCQLSRGSVCGEFSSILFKKRTLKVQCLTWSEFYSINIDDIKEILELYYPKSSISKWNKIKEYVKYAYKHNIKHNVDLNNFSDTFESHTNATQHIEESFHLFDTSAKPFIFTDDAERNSNEIVIITNDIDDNICDHVPKSEKIIKTNDETSKNIKTNVFKDFQIRSNSELRNFAVVAHAEKHSKLSIPVTKKSRNPLFESKTSDETTTISKQMGMEIIDKKPNVFNKKATSSSMCSVYSSVGSSADSEYSFSMDTQSTSEENNDENIHRQYVKQCDKNIDQSRHRKKDRAKVKFKKKKVKVGKFGGRKGVGRGRNAKHKKMANNTKIANYDDTDRELKPLTRHVSASCDASLLLLPLSGMLKSVEHEQQPYHYESDDDIENIESMGKNIQNINVNVSDVMDVIMNDKNDTNLDGRITPLFIASINNSIRIKKDRHDT